MSTIATSRRASVSRLRLVRAVMFFMAAGLLALGVWGMNVTRADDHAKLDHRQVVPGGFLVVDTVNPQIIHHKMIGMDPDPVPEGKIRFTVGVTLSATDDLSFSADDFAVVVGNTGVSIAPRRTWFGSSTIKEGQQTSGMLMFDVPEDAERLALVGLGAERGIPLTPEEVHPATEPDHPDP